MSRNPSRRLLVQIAAATTLAVSALAAPAQANVTPLDATIQYTSPSSSTCDAPAWVWPYKAIGDARMYVLAPAGSFTGNSAGWQLRGGARIATDAARGAGLALPAGASAISPGMCVDLDYPHMRFAHKLIGTGSALELKTEVVYPQVVNPTWTDVKQFDGYQGSAVASGWRISPEVDLKPDFGGQLAGARYVALRFTAVKKAATTAEFRVDDMFVDPFRRG